MEGSAMTQSAKQRVTGDVVILVVGAAVVLVLFLVGAL
jgi:hypothetical protein